MRTLWMLLCFLFLFSGNVYGKTLDLQGLTEKSSGEGWTWNPQESTLVLEGLDLSAQEGSGLVLPKGDVKVVLKGENQIFAQENGIGTWGSVTFLGTGSLQITAMGGNGIEAKNLTLEDGNYVIYGGKCGMFAALGDINIYGGTISVYGDMFGIGTYGKVEKGQQLGGRITVCGGKVTAQGQWAAISANLYKGIQGCPISYEGMKAETEPVGGVPAVGLDEHMTFHGAQYYGATFAYGVLDYEEPVFQTGACTKVVLLETAQPPTVSEVSIPVPYFYDTKTHPNKDEIGRVVQRGILTVQGQEGMHPEGIVTRGMMAEMLYRMENRPEIGPCPFWDVPQEYYGVKAVAWVEAQGLMVGLGSGKFSPDAPITEEQVAAVLNRYGKMHGKTVDGLEQVGKDNVNRAEICVLLQPFLD